MQIKSNALAPHKSRILDRAKSIKIASLMLATSIACFSTLQAYAIQNAPKATKRANPMNERNTVYSYHDAIVKATKAVVNISTQKKVSNNIMNPMFNDPFFQQFFGDMYSQIPKDRVERSLGSGVIM